MYSQSRRSTLDKRCPLSRASQHREHRIYRKLTYHRQFRKVEPPSPPPGCDTITANKDRTFSCIGFIAGLLSLRATPLVERNEHIGHTN